MALRVKERTLTCIGSLLLASQLLAQPALHYEVWRGHSRIYTMPPSFTKIGDTGTLTIDETGVSFQNNRQGKPPQHAVVWRWKYADIQQLTISPRSLTVLTYQDNPWKFGADRQYRFDIISGAGFENAYQLLKNRLDQRFVSAIADSPATVLWETSVKHLVGWGGDQGVLQVGADRITYKSENTKASRTWRYEDIDNITSSGPFELTLVTFQRDKADYGSRKQFTFRLKQRLEESRYNDLWLRLNESKGLKVLESYRQEPGGTQ